MHTKPDMPPPTPLAWYVVETRYASVRDVYLKLALAFGGAGEVWAPFDPPERTGSEKRSGRPREDSLVPRFGRFIFVHCRLTPSLHSAIKAQHGVIGFLRSSIDARPAVVTEDQIAWAKAHQPDRPDENPYLVGDIIRIRKAAVAFMGLQAKVTKVDKSGVIVADIDLLGRPTPIVIEVGHVELVQRTQSHALATFSQSRTPRSAKPARKSHKRAA